MNDIPRRLMVLHVDPNPTYHYSDPEWVYVLDANDTEYRSLITYLQRMQDGGAIDDFWTEEFHQTEVKEVLLRAVKELAPRLARDEDGEDTYSEGGEGLDEKHMREAGRIR